MKTQTRREFICAIARWGSLGLMGLGTGALVARRASARIPDICRTCGKLERGCPGLTAPLVGCPAPERRRAPIAIHPSGGASHE